MSFLLSTRGFKCRVTAAGLHLHQIQYATAKRSSSFAGGVTDGCSVRGPARTAETPDCEFHCRLVFASPSCFRRRRCKETNILKPLNIFQQSSGLISFLITCFSRRLFSRVHGVRAWLNYSPRDAQLIRVPETVPVIPSLLITA